MDPRVAIHLLYALMMEGGQYVLESAQSLVDGVLACDVEQDAQHPLDIFGRAALAIVLQESMEFDRALKRGDGRFFSQW